MASSGQQIVLKIKADIRNAIDSVRTLGKQVDDTGRRVDGLSGRFTKVGQAATRLLTAGGGLRGYLNQLDEAGATLDRVTGAAANVAKNIENLQFAGSAQETEDAFFAAVNARAKSFAESGGFFGNLRSVGVDIGRRVSGRGRPVSPSTEREAVEFFRELARTDPARATALLSQPDLDRLEYLRPRFQAELARANAGRAYTQQIGSNLQVVNVYTGVGDRNQIGREVRAALDSRDRNNGRYVTSYTRR